MNLCTDVATGEEIYFNTALPSNLGTWNSEEEALKAIGARIADEFSREFFLQHANGSERRADFIRIKIFLVVAPGATPA